MPKPKTTAAVKSAKTSLSFDRLIKKAVEQYTLKTLRKGTKLFSQGEKGDAIYFLRTGEVQLTVMSPRGKEAVLARLGPHDFLGEECLVRHSLRTSTATSMEPSTVVRIAKRFMLQALHADQRLSEAFMTALLGRNINLEEDLTDQLFNHSERRLACVLLKLSRAGQQNNVPDATLPKVTQAMLAEKLGTTAAKVSGYMQKFRRLGLIDYKGLGSITVRSEALTEAVLHA